MMHNWLDAWRSLQNDCVQVAKTTSRFKKLVRGHRSDRWLVLRLNWNSLQICLAAQQIDCYELILSERRTVNDTLIQFIADAEVLSSKRLASSCTMRREHQAILSQLVGLKVQLAERNNTLVKFKLELHCLRQRLRSQALKTNRMTARLKQSKLLTEKLLENNNSLNARVNISLSIYRYIQSVCSLAIGHRIVRAL